MSDDATGPVLDIPSDGPAPVRLDRPLGLRSPDDRPIDRDTPGSPLG